MTPGFHSPTSLEDALKLLNADDYTLLSGGTDFYPGLKDKKSADNILNISNIAGLHEITEDKDYLKIGAGITWTDIINADLPSAFDGLKKAAREIGSVQIQNRATLVGNVCNASPAADGVPALLTLDALVRLSSVSGERDVPLSDFILGNRKTAIRPNELALALLIPKRTLAGQSTFLKLGARKYLVISIAMVAVRLVSEDDAVITEAAISVGACSLVAKRLPSLEAELLGKPLKGSLQESVKPHHLQELAPIDDIRASAAYRMAAGLELIKRALSELTEG